MGHRGAPFSFHFALSNPATATAALLVPRVLEPLGAFVTVQIADGAGQIVYETNPPKFAPKLDPESPEAYVSLDPGYSYGTTFVDERVSLAPGDYDVKLVYSNLYYRGYAAHPLGEQRCATTVDHRTIVAGNWSSYRRTYLHEHYHWETEWQGEVKKSLIKAEDAIAKLSSSAATEADAKAELEPKATKIFDDQMKAARAAYNASPTPRAARRMSPGPRASTRWSSASRITRPARSGSERPTSKPRRAVQPWRRARGRLLAVGPCRVLGRPRWYIPPIDIMPQAKKRARAKVFWTGRSQAIRLPKEFRFEGDTVMVRREGSAVILEPADDWPEGYVASFSGIPASFERPPQGRIDRREKL